MTSDAPKEKKPAAPQWALAAFHLFFEQAERLENVVWLSVQGISGLRGIPNIFQVLAEVDEKLPDHDEQLASARKQADLAQKEIDLGFPLLFGNATVTLWSYLESMVRAALVAWLKNDLSVWQVDTIARLRVRLGEYEQLSPEERLYYVAELIESETAAGLRNGIERFEAMLKPFRLEGAVPAQLRRDMFEFGQIRNAIVHRGGRTDRQLTNSCPWLNLSLGSDLPIGREQFNRYRRATHNYVLLLICRVGEQFGRDTTQHRQAVFAEYGAA